VVPAKVQSASEANYGGLATEVVDVECLAYSVVIGCCRRIVGR
jgi:hypothetical protein